MYLHVPLAWRIIFPVLRSKPENLHVLLSATLVEQRSTHGGMHASCYAGELLAAHM